VLNLTLHALAHFARDDPELYREVVPILRNHQADTRKSVAKRATKLLAQLQQAPQPTTELAAHGAKSLYVTIA
jgi:hypothetical protein